MENKKTAVIIGAGIGGITTAILNSKTLKTFNPAFFVEWN
jgi:cation diffusion facilitator CzcD-associated flavoprotein CzcO